MYYGVFIDDFSRNTWIVFLKAKGEVFKCFKELKALVENKTGKKMKVLRSDNGGEYTSGKFVYFCASEGIWREFTVPYTPQQNGVVERKNGAIIGATRAMLHDQGLPLFLWADLQYDYLLTEQESSKVLGECYSKGGFLGRGLNLYSYVFFGVLHILRSPRRRGPSWIPLQRRGFLWGTVTPLRHIGSIFLPCGVWWLGGM